MRSSRRLFQFAREPNGGMIRPQEPDGMTPARKLPRERRRNSPWVAAPRAHVTGQRSFGIMHTPHARLLARRHFLSAFCESFFASVSDDGLVGGRAAAPCCAPKACQLCPPSINLTHRIVACTHNAATGQSDTIVARPPCWRPGAYIAYAYPLLSVFTPPTATTSFTAAAPATAAPSTARA